MKTLTSFCLALTLTAGVSPALPAQEVNRRVEAPTPLDASDPLAVESATLVKHVLAAEKDAAVALLRKKGDEAYLGRGTVEQDVEAQIKRLAKGSYRISRFERGFGTDVVVFLTNDRNDTANIVVRYTADARISGFATAIIQQY